MYSCALILDVSGVLCMESTQNSGAGACIKYLKKYDVIKAYINATSMNVKFAVKEISKIM